MRRFALVTIMLAHRRGDAEFDVRNACVRGGVLEDPAAGAAGPKCGPGARRVARPGFATERIDISRNLQQNTATMRTTIKTKTAI